MDTRSGQLYPDLKTAREAGVPREHLQEVDVIEVMALAREPTHWMPLPPPPDAPQEDR